MVSIHLLFVVGMKWVIQEHIGTDGHKVTDALFVQIYLQKLGMVTCFLAYTCNKVHVRNMKLGFR